MNFLNFLDLSKNELISLLPMVTTIHQIKCKSYVILGLTGCLCAAGIGGGVLKTLVII